MTTTPSRWRVGAWMRAPVHVAHPNDPICHARELCERHRVNQLPVVAGERLAGIVTDRDLRDAFPSVAQEVTEPTEAHRLTASLRVEDIMTRNVVTVTDEDTIDHAATIMRQERIGALPVVREGRLVGIVTRTDLLGALVAVAQERRPGPSR